MPQLSFPPIRLLTLCAAVACAALGCPAFAQAAAPDVTAPDVTAPDVTAPDVTAPDVTAPDVQVVPPPPAPPVKDPPRTWVDKDTGHRVTRLTDEPNSGAPYFNVNAYTPDGREMIYTAPDGIHVLDLAARRTRLVVPSPPAVPGQRGGGGVHAIVVGHKTPTVFYTRFDPAAKATGLYATNVDTGATRKLADLPPRAGIDTVNADETLGAGTYVEGNGADYNNQRPAPGAPPPGVAGAPGAFAQGPNVQPADKAQMMEQRLAARLPLVLFTLDLHTGRMKTLLHSTDWVNHLLFSPTDPALLMYCHEGPWQKVDRIWTVRTDGTHNALIHRRTMAMEIAGHEFWGLDGRTIWYDWQYPKGQEFFLAGYNLQTGRHTAFRMERNEWSIHFNVTAGETLFAGDGGDPGQVARAPDGEWIELFHPRMIASGGALNTPDFWQPGVFQSEHLVNMSRHDYRQEPNVRFSPDKSLVIFTSNMFGPSYVFGVEVARADAGTPSP